MVPGQAGLYARGEREPVIVLAWSIPMDGGAWWAMVHGVTKELDMTEHSNTLAT